MHLLGDEDWGLCVRFTDLSLCALPTQPLFLHMEGETTDCSFPPSLLRSIFSNAGAEATSPDLFKALRFFLSLPIPFSHSPTPCSKHDFHSTYFLCSIENTFLKIRSRAPLKFLMASSLPLRMKSRYFHLPQGPAGLPPAALSSFSDYSSVPCFSTWHFCVLNTPTCCSGHRASALGSPWSHGCLFLSINKYVSDLSSRRASDSSV